MDTQPFSNLVIIYLLAYEDGTACSETSAYKIQTPGNYPEENIQHTEQGGSLKSKNTPHFHGCFHSHTTEGTTKCTGEFLCFELFSLCGFSDDHFEQNQLTHTKDWKATLFSFYMSFPFTRSDPLPQTRF